MIALAWALLLAQIPPSSPAPRRSIAEAIGVRTFPGEVSVCPRNDSDCRLTVVDHSLCDWLAELLDPAKDEFHDPYNCLKSSERTYVCLNILARQKVDGEKSTHYTDPYMLELASLYERELDQCLPKWGKSKSLAQAGPGLAYEDRDRFILLSITPYRADGAVYDRLTLSIKDSP